MHIFLRFYWRASIIKTVLSLTEDVSVTEIFNSSRDEEDSEGFDEDEVAAAERLRQISGQEDDKQKKQKWAECECRHVILLLLVSQQSNPN